MLMKRLTNETGATYIVIIALVLAAVIIGFIFIDFFSTYVSKHVGQTSADAASLAVAEEMRKTYESRLRDEIEYEITELRSEVIDEVDRLVDERTEYDEDGNVTYVPNRNSIWQEVINNWNIPQPINNKLQNNNYSLDGAFAANYFFSEEQLAIMICSEINSNMNRIYEVANHYIESNYSDEAVDIVFPYRDKFEVYVRARRDTTFITVGDTQDMFTGAAASIRLPDSLSINLNYCN